MPCLDSCVFIDLLRQDRRGHGAAARRLVEEITRTREPLMTTRFTVAELLVGVYRSRDPDKSRTHLDRLLQDVVILEFSEQAMERFAVITAYLRSRGTPIGDMEVLIASVALAHGQRIVTRNSGHLGLVPGLELITYGPEQRGK